VYLDFYNLKLRTINNQGIKKTYTYPVQKGNLMEGSLTSRFISVYIEKCITLNRILCTMKKRTWFWWLICAPCFLSAQFPVHPDSLFTFMRFQSVYRDRVNWEDVHVDFSSCIRTSKNLNDTMTCFVEILKTLDDVHSQIYLNNKYYGHSHFLGDSAYKAIQPIRDRAFASTGKINSTTLHKKYAYILIPGINAYSEDQIDMYSQMVRDSLLGVYKKGIEGFIVDLRLNTGGNMYPMLCGLSSLLGNTTIGYETDVNDSVVRKWELIQHHFFIGGYQVTHLQKQPIKDGSKIPVVVIIGPMTNSSGSMTAIAFKKRPHTIFVGESTADGYTTSNAYFQFAPNLVLNFATNFVADRKRTIYKTTVDPDITISGGDNFDDLENDEKIKTAIQWFQKN
jgi:carboxyl-terminal processing protease